MSESDWGLDREYELFREASRGTGRLVLLTVVFGLFGLFRVVEPYHGYTVAIGEQEAALARLVDERERAAPDRARAEQLEESLRAYTESLPQEPWVERKDTLIAELTDLGQACAVLRATEPATVERVLRLGPASLDVERPPQANPPIEQVPDARSTGRPIGSATAPRRSAATRPAAFGSPLQEGPGTTTTVERPGPTAVQHPGPTAVTSEDERALRTLSERYRVPVEELRGVIEHLRALRQTPESAPDGAREPVLTFAEAMRRDQVVARAAEALALAPEDLAQRAAAADWNELLHGRLAQLTQQRADHTIEAIVGDVERDFVEPLRALLDGTEAEGALPHSRAALEQVGEQLEQWERDHVGERDWWRTRDQKAATVDAFGARLHALTDTARTAVESDLESVQSEVARLEEEQAEREQEIAELEQSRTSLAASLERILPEWLRGLVLPEDMMQLFPLMLLVAVALVTYRAALVRYHFLGLQDGLVERGDEEDARAVSSLWTLVRRGPLRTAATGATYCAVALLTWWLFERSLALTDSWLGTAAGSEGWALLRENGEAVVWFGRALFLAAASGLLLSLAARNEPRTAPAMGLGEV